MLSPPSTAQGALRLQFHIKMRTREEHLATLKYYWASEMMLLFVIMRSQYTHRIFYLLIMNTKPHI